MKYSKHNEISIHHSLLFDDGDEYQLERAWNNPLWLNTIDELLADVHYYDVKFKYYNYQHRFTRVNDVRDYLSIKQRDCIVDIYLYYPPLKNYCLFRTESLSYKRNNQLTLF